MLQYKNWLYLLIGTASAVAAMIGFAKYSSIPQIPQFEDTKEIAHGSHHHSHGHGHHSHHHSHGHGHHAHHHGPHGHHFAHHHFHHNHPHHWYWQGGDGYWGGTNWGNKPGYYYDPNYYYNVKGTPAVQYNPLQENIYNVEQQQQLEKIEQNLRFNNPQAPGYPPAPGQYPTQRP